VYLSAAAAAAAQHIVFVFEGIKAYTINNLLQREAPDETENKRILAIFALSLSLLLMQWRLIISMSMFTFSDGVPEFVNMGISFPPTSDANAALRRAGLAVSTFLNNSLAL
jgi:hypothetical protein